MTTKQTKRKYMKPAFKTVWLQQRSMLLAGSGGGGTQDYHPNTPQTWP